MQISGTTFLLLSFTWVQMCPSAQPPFEIGLYWSDDHIILSLEGYLQGSDLPANVLAESSPFLYPPSNLPEGMWYLVRSNEKKESDHGFWRAKGEACKVYSNTQIIGWRTTLEYFERLAPDGQITDWCMQEYSITSKESSEKYKPKDSRLLCRVFLCSGHSPRSEMNPGKCKTIVESKNYKPVVSVNPSTNITSDQDAGNESRAERENEVETCPVVADTTPNSPPGYFSEEDCFSRGDFLELNDLEIPGSHSSSSQNSSCPSNLSEEYFGSSAFLRDIEEVANTLKQEEGQQFSSSGHRFTVSVAPIDVVLQPPLSGSSVSCSVIPDVTETSRARSGSDNNSLTDGRVQGSSTKRHNPESKTDDSSNSDSPPSTSSKNAEPSEEKKAGSSRLKKFRTFFCFAAF